MSTTTSLQLVNHILTALTADLTQASAETWKAIVPVYQINAIQNLVYGGIGLVCMIASLLTIVYLLIVSHKCERGKRTFWYNGRDDVTGLWIVLITTSAVIGFVSTLVVLINLTNVWNWVALYNPQAYTIHCFLNQITLATGAN